MKKYLVLTDEDVILVISDTLEYQENGNPLVNNGRLAVAQYLVKNIVEVDSSEMPEEVEVEKWCYSKEKGFYENPNYVEPPKPISLTDLQEQINNIELALTEMYEMGGNV